MDRFKADVLLCSSSASLVALRQTTSTIPIIFTNVFDPVAQGFVLNLAHPGGNVTGFGNLEVSIAAKWVDLLKQMVPSIARNVFLFNPETAPQAKFFVSTAVAAGRQLGIEVVPAPTKSFDEVEAALAGLAQESNVGLIFPPDTSTILHLKAVVDAVAHYRLPAIYAGEQFTTAGGLMQYYRDPSEAYRQVPYYVDRILKGAKPGDLPVQMPTKFRFTINSKTARALGIEVPLGLLLTADEVVE